MDKKDPPKLPPFLWTSFKRAPHNTNQKPGVSKMQQPTLGEEAAALDRQQYQTNKHD